MIYHELNLDKFTEETRRMCNSIGCDACPLRSETLTVCRLFKSAERLDKILHGVYDWSVNNPRTTNMQKFREVFDYQFLEMPDPRSSFWTDEYKGDTK